MILDNKVAAQLVPGSCLSSEAAGPSVCTWGRSQRILGARARIAQVGATRGVCKGRARNGFAGTKGAVEARRTVA
jgi:hypothetical protein